MALSTIWWLLAGLVIITELMTGTFYLLMISSGLVAGAVAAHMGLGMNTQIIVAAVISSGATLAWHFYKAKQPRALQAQANRDVNLDIGETVHVDAWSADGTAAVKYRGAQWTVQAAPGAAQATGSYRVKEVAGSRLIVEPV
jgi:membrane protein implicated in regulation of membrane protease activity